MRYQWAIALLSIASLFPNQVSATVGFAEWRIVTPGGNIISHNDPWKSDYGDVLKADGESNPANFFITHLKRWQYYPQHVIGESRDGFFVLNESTQAIQHYSTESELMVVAAQDQLGTPTSEWLTGGDGWWEAWYPFVVWQPCQKILGNIPSTEAEQPYLASLGLSPASCQQQTSTTTLRQYRDRTWGPTCAKVQTNSNLQQQESPLRGFCEALLSVSE